MIDAGLAPAPPLAADEPSAADLAELEAALAAEPTLAAADDGAAPAIATGDTPPTWAEFWDGWSLFSDAIYSAAIAGAVLGFLSVYVVLRRLVFVSAIVTQAAGLGVALTFFAAIHLGLHVDPHVGAVTLVLVTAGLVSVDARRLGLSPEMLIGVLFAITAAGAILVGSRITQEAHDIDSIMFGTAVVVGADDLRHLLVIGAIVMAVQAWWRRGFAMVSFDAVAARVQGLPVRLLDLALLLSIGVMVAEAARALGALPAFAMSTLPAVAALALTRGPLPVTFALAAVLGAVAGVAGYLLAFFHELPVGSAQTMTAAGLVVAAVVVRAAALLVRRVGKSG